VEEVHDMEFDTAEGDSENLTSDQNLQTALLVVADIEWMLTSPVDSDFVSKADRYLRFLAERLGISPD
jgi:hypothetical protein